jgi:hypothetical protein
VRRVRHVRHRPRKTSASGQRHSARARNLTDASRLPLPPGDERDRPGATPALATESFAAGKRSGTLTLAQWHPAGAALW